MSIELFKRTDAPDNYQAKLTFPDGTVKRISCRTRERDAAQAIATERYYDLKAKLQNGLALSPKNFRDFARLFISIKPDYTSPVNIYLIPEWG